MNVTLNFFNNSNDSNVLNKNLVNGATIQATLKQDTATEEPVFVLSKSGYDSYYNYLYCEELGRYYFVDTPTILQGGIVELHCSVDVLMTYANDIKNIECTIARNETKIDGYLYDDAYKIRAYKDIVTKTFPRGLTENSLVLITLG